MRLFSGSEETFTEFDIDLEWMDTFPDEYESIHLIGCFPSISERHTSSCLLEDELPTFLLLEVDESLHSVDIFWEFLKEGIEFLSIESSCDLRTVARETRIMGVIIWGRSEFLRECLVDASGIEEEIE